MNCATDKAAFQSNEERKLGQRINHGTYWPYIDGLRCVAVLPVVMYHLAMSLCPAGFMGVDIFFVISGYLICGGIMRDLKIGNFNLRSFYFRRIRRIFPAYFVVVVAVLITGIALYHSSRIVPLAQTVTSSALFSQNLYFWLDMGYFQPNAHENPLLHLWSLGIEEQFYIFAPIALLLIWQFRPAWLVRLLGIGLLGSLILCIVMGENGHSTTTFYLLPTRAWELFAGALIVALPAVKKSRWSILLSWLGLILVLTSFWCFSTERTFDRAGTSLEFVLPFFGVIATAPFPGWVNLPVVAGSMLLLRYGNAGTIGSLLSSRFFIGIGKISYSLYLWHWPITVFATYIIYDEPGPFTFLVILGLSFMFAYASWRWVEMPVRCSTRFTPRFAFASTALACSLLIIASTLLVNSDGLRNQLHQAANIHISPPRPFLPNLEKLLPSPKPFEPPPFPEVDPQYVLRIGAADGTPFFCLLGDSHAACLAPGLDVAAARRGLAGYYIKKHLHPSGENDPKTNEKMLQEWVVSRSDIRDVYFVGRWLEQFLIRDGLPQLGEKGAIQPVPLDHATALKIEMKLRRTAEWFSKGGKRLFIFTCVPEYAYSPTDVMARSLIIPIRHPIEITHEDYLNRQKPISEIFQRLAAEGLLTIVPLHSAFTDGGKTVFMSSRGEPFYSDGNHLTPEGARHAAEILAPFLWPNRSTK